MSQKTAQCLWCKEGGIKRRYPVETMKPVEDETLGTGYLCPVCCESAAKDEEAQAEYDREQMEADMAAEHYEREKAKGEPQ